MEGFLCTIETYLLRDCQLISCQFGNGNERVYVDRSYKTIIITAGRPWRRRGYTYPKSKERLRLCLEVTAAWSLFGSYRYCQCDASPSKLQEWRIRVCSIQINIEEKKQTGHRANQRTAAANIDGPRCYEWTNPYAGIILRHFCQPISNGNGALRRCHHLWWSKFFKFM